MFVGFLCSGRVWVIELQDLYVPIRISSRYYNVVFCLISSNVVFGWLGSPNEGPSIIDNSIRASSGQFPYKRRVQFPVGYVLRAFSFSDISRFYWRMFCVLQIRISNWPCGYKFWVFTLVSLILIRALCSLGHLRSAYFLNFCTLCFVYFNVSVRALL